MSEVRLAERPDDERARELWLQHAAGWVLVRDVREEAREKLPDGLSPEAREAALKAIDDALYGVAMVADGIGPPLRNDRHRVDVRIVARVTDETSG